MFSKFTRFSSSVFMALKNPADGQFVARIGELTGEQACSDLLLKMITTCGDEGKAILNERPLISDKSIRELTSSFPKGSLGDAYLSFMDRHKISADSRAPIKWMDKNDPRAYVLLRYRQVHDFWHVLAGDVPISIYGELALKWFEYFQTKLPMTLLAGGIAPLVLLNSSERNSLYKIAIPWAYRNAPPHAAFLLGVYYEKHLTQPIETFRQKLGIVPFPSS